MCLLIVATTYSCGDVFYHDKQIPGVQPVLTWCDPVRRQEKPICPPVKQQPKAIQHDELVCSFCEKYRNEDYDCRKEKPRSEKTEEMEGQEDDRHPVRFVYKCGHYLELRRQDPGFRAMLRSFKWLPWATFEGEDEKPYHCVWQSTGRRRVCRFCEVHSYSVRVFL